MSIVEKALQKVLQQSPPQPRPDSTVTRTRIPKARDVSVGTTTTTIETRLVPRESISLDSGLLRNLGVLPPQDSEERLKEQFRHVKRPIVDFALGRTLPKPERTNVAMVTSSVAGEGKTFTSFNLALSIAQEKDVSVLLVDADVAKRHSTASLGLEGRSGLTDVLTDPALDPEGLVLGTDIAGLTILPSGKRVGNVPELFASERMVEIVCALAKADSRRIILFDSAPLLMTNESQALGRIVDQIVLIVRAESTPQPVLLEAIGVLDKSIPIRCILNQARTSGMTEYYYGYGYYQNGRPAT
jgi:protein-tyrosine kinase